jgi:hypothetical protein
MPKIIIVETNGSVKEATCQDATDSGLYKAIKLKSAAGFTCQTTWNVTIADDTFAIALYAKVDGKAGQENKYDFPPPVDTALFFGKCVLVNRGGDLTLPDWNRIYENLFGGFEDLNSEGEGDEDDEDDYDELPLTVAGYAKDGFVVDSDTSEVEPESEEEDEEVESESDDSDTDKKKKKKKAKPKTKAVAKTKVKAAAKPRVAKNKAAEPYVDCTEELQEEDYV